MQPGLPAAWLVLSACAGAVESSSGFFCGGVDHRGGPSGRCIVESVETTSPEATPAPRSLVVLELGAIDTNGAPDPALVTLAGELTAALRAEASGAFVVIEVDPAAQKTCGDLACIVERGRSLHADRVLAGRLEKSTNHTIVTAMLVDVNRERVVRSRRAFVRASDMADHTALARQLVPELAHEGSITIDTNVDRGTVFIDDTPRMTLISGRALLEGVASGRHELVLEAPAQVRCRILLVMNDDEQRVVVRFVAP